MAENGVEDPDTTIVEVGDEKILVPPLVWYNLRRLESFLRSKQEKPDGDRYDAIDTALTVITEALVLHRPECTKEYLEKKLLASQADNFFVAYLEVLSKSGFTATGSAAAGEGEAAGQDNPGTGMLNGSSQSALPETSTPVIGSESSAG